MTTKVERDRAEQFAKMTKWASEYDPPRPWLTKQAPSVSGEDFPPTTYVVDANGAVIPEFTTHYPSAMLRRVLRAVNLTEIAERMANTQDPDFGKHDRGCLCPCHSVNPERVISAVGTLSCCGDGWPVRTSGNRVEGK